MKSLRKGGIVNLIESHVTKYGVDNKYRAYESAGAQFSTLYENFKERKENGVDLRMTRVLTLAEACLDEAGIDTSLLEAEDTAIVVEAVGSSSFPNITRFIVNSEIIPQFEREERRLSSLFTELPSTSSSLERIAGLTAAEGVEKRSPGAPTKRTDILEKFAEIQIDKYDRSIDLTQEAIFDDRLGQLINRASQLGETFGTQFEKYLMQTIELVARSLRGEGSVEAAKFDGTVVSQSDFYKNDHSALLFMGSQTNDNNQTDALSIGGLDNAMILFSEMADENGEKITVRPKQLLVSVSKTLTAWEITRSISRPDTANDAANMFGPNGSRTFEVIDTTFLADSDDWYLGDFQKQVVVLFWKRPIVTTAGKNHPDVFERDIVMAWKFSAGFGMGHRDYRYIVRSNVA